MGRRGRWTDREMHRFQEILEKSNSYDRFHRILKQTKDDDRFMRAFELAHERAFGRPHQTSNVNLTDEFDNLRQEEVDLVANAAKDLKQGHRNGSKTNGLEKAE